MLISFPIDGGPILLPLAQRRKGLVNTGRAM
jgi:hypothetical protein